MTRLFFRFYLGVILILVVAWVIQAYVFQGTTEAANMGVVEEALAGGALLARDQLSAGGPDNMQSTLAEIQTRFAYPVNIVKRADRQMSAATALRIQDGQAVLFRGRVNAAIPDTDLLVELGPLPKFVGPSQRDILLGLGSVFLLVAVSIAILMRPIANQLRTVEHAALAIAKGDLSVRISEDKQDRGLPIVAAFNNMADRVERLLQSQKELLQAVSHDLRTPLARIKFATELVRSAEDEPKRQERLDAIDDATDHLDLLVGELLDYTRQDEGNESSKLENVCINDLVSESIAAHSPLHSAISFRGLDAAPLIQIVTYRAGLSRAIGNLISNAGKYSKSQVLVDASADDRLLRITVDDDGSGIAQCDRELIFEPFRRLGGDSQYGKSPAGMGLGLALVRRICRRMQGEVTVSESPLGGARFEIRVPFDEPRS
ncbi:Sensor protein RstB [Rubripirellula lacrimiformis]|uniref:histidine kinase n=1 Tax=Rubripirellula lacrimiformis TaxID=1930273 RepID=A0A517NE68_9BACT|nr:ATP-binding protein [Rubripirellula lacrimiformis]QDT05419.1 Sensor protein RstB [Rubripirellula lacrimiformis]